MAQQKIPTKDELVRFIGSRRYKPMPLDELARQFQLDHEGTEKLKDRLNELQLAGQVVRGRSQRWMDPRRAGMTVARLQGNEAGFAFAIPVASGEDIYIAPDAMGDAMHNDIVLVERVARKRRRGRRPLRKMGPSGRIERVVRRANTELVGRYTPGAKGGHVVAEDPKISQEVFIPPGSEGGAEGGELVLVGIDVWPSHTRSGNPEGTVLRVIGREGEPGVDVQCVAVQYNLLQEFSERALRDAQAMPADPPEEQKRKRRDFRDYTTVAIDPADARDRDDALSIYMDRRTGRRVVLVHIADVSNYVYPSSALDQDARERGCSVYLVSDFLPMLPKELTQQVLSFAEGRDRLAKTVILEFDSDGELANSSICHSVANIDRALSYVQVGGIIEAAAQATAETRVEEACEKLDGEEFTPQIVQAVLELDDLARQLRQRRHALGSVDLDVPEYDVHTDEDGRVVAITQVERDRSHSLVEEFMLSANCAVARFLQANNLPGAYRVHDEPDPETLEEFADFVLSTTHKVVNPLDRKDLQNLLEDVADTDVAQMVNMQLLRSMKRAEYLPKPQSHYALHFRPYCHFTSPIRRYPDLVVHQVLDQYFAGKLASEQVRVTWWEKLPDICRSSTEAERRADEAEREIIKLKILRYLHERAGVHEEVFEAVITGVQEYGVFAQIKGFPTDGLISVRTLVDDVYEYNEQQKALIGSRKKQVLRLGDTVRVRIESIDVTRRQMNLILARGT